MKIGHINLNEVSFSKIHQIYRLNELFFIEGTRSYSAIAKRRSLQL
nr:hypothetical protein K4M19_00461 [Agrobacterium fabrum]